MAYSVAFKGVAPILFDRFAGSTETKMPTERKAYFLNEKEKTLMLPALNIYSMLSSQNGLSAARLIGGKKWKEVSSAVLSHVRIDPLEIPLVDEKGEVIKFTGFDGERFIERVDKAIVIKGRLQIPQMKLRFQLNPPWGLRFRVYVAENNIIDSELLRSLFEHSGEQIGLGSFRPLFGRFVVSDFKFVK